MRHFTVIAAIILLNVCFAAHAADIVIYDYKNPGEWIGDREGYQTEISAGTAGKFRITTNREDATLGMISPQKAGTAWRVPDESSFTIESEEMMMRNLLIVFDDCSDCFYVREGILSHGWKGTLHPAAAKYELINPGSKILKVTAAYGEMRIRRIVVSDRLPDQPGNPDDNYPDDAETLVYANGFDEDISDWSIENDLTFSGGWNLRRSRGCIAVGHSDSADDNADDAQEELELRSLISRRFSIPEAKAVRIIVEQSFFGEYPAAQSDWAEAVVREPGGSWRALLFDGFPAPADGWSRFVKNSVDITQYAGTELEIGFRYLNPAQKKRGWALRNFMLFAGDLSGLDQIQDEVDKTAVYFDMQGRRVIAPASGIYIEMKDGKRKKIIL